MNTYDIVGYVYEAAVHCPECTQKRFPNFKGIDREGNEIGPYTLNEAEESAADGGCGSHCDDCHEPLCEIPDPLENVEIFESEYVECIHCGAPDLNCVGVCERYCQEHNYSERRKGWFHWVCHPGCLPDSDPFGPFKTEEEARKHALEFHGD